MPRLAALLAGLAAFAGASGDGGAAQPDSPLAGQPFELTADVLEYEAARDLYIASGSVRIRQGERTLTADWVAFNNTSGRGVASGNVVFVDDEDTLRAHFAEFNVLTLEGVIFDGSFVSERGDFHAEAAVITKRGDRTYGFEEGTFSTCHCPDDGPDPWQIKAEKADLEVDGYGTARNTTVEVLGVPVVWLPWMIYPVKTRRQTGFLLPELSVGSRNGVTVGLPFFWAARENLNLTVTPRYLTKRGPKAEIEAEFVLGEESKGDLFGAYLYDHDIDADTPQDPFDENRWAVSGEQDLFLPFDTRYKANFNFISDNEYTLDFPELDDLRFARFVESQGFAARQLGGVGQYGVMLGASFVDDQQSPDDVDRDKYLLQRLPDLVFGALPQQLPWLKRLVPALDVHYTHFYPRRDAIDELGADNLSANGLFLDTGIDAQPDTRGGALAFFERNPNTGVPAGGDPSGDNTPTGTESNGFFDEGEPLVDKGHRLVLRPRLGVPFRVANYFEVYPEASWYQTLYHSDVMDFEERGLFTGRVDLRSRLTRRFGKGVTHLLEPRLGYALVTHDSQGSNPLFVPQTAVPQQRLRGLDLDNVVLDPADRIRKFNGLTWGLGNRLFAAGGGEEAARLLADFTLQAGYDFETSRFASLYLDGRAYPFEGATARFNLGFDPEDAQLDEALFEVSWRAEAGHSAGLTYRFLRDIPQFFENYPYEDNRFDSPKTSFGRINQIEGAVRWAVTRGWSIHYRGVYSFESSLLIGNLGGIEYTSRCRCWSAGVEVSQDRERGIRFSLLYRLTGLGDDTPPRSTGGVGFP
ncbi:MAG: LPS assembly protein LptD [Myxococcota bacterium]